MLIISSVQRQDQKISSSKSDMGKQGVQGQTRLYESLFQTEPKKRREIFTGNAPASTDLQNICVP